MKRGTVSGFVLYLFLCGIQGGFQACLAQAAPPVFQMGRHAENEQHAAVLQRVIGRAEVLLPSAFRGLAPPIQVSIQPLPARRLASVDGIQLDIPREAALRSSRPRYRPWTEREWEIVLDPSVFAENEEHVLRCLLHEMTHLWLKLRPVRELAAEPARMPYAKSRALPLRSRRVTASASRAFLDLALWDTPTTSRHLRRKRFPDPYESKNSEEFFCVNVESWLLDPEYPLRRPTLSRYFDTLFGHAPERPRPTRHVFSGWDKPFSTEKLKSVRFLLATEGSAVASRWGHAMLLLRFGEAEDEVGLGDQRIVVGFLAIADFQGDIWKGLFGGYPLRLFVLPFEQVVFQYTYAENRDLEEYSIELSPQQREQLLERISELYWDYEGDYRFLSRNCASELFFHLRPVLPADAQARDTRPATPRGVLRRLQDAGLSPERPVEIRSSRLAMAGKSMQMLREVGFPDLETYLDSRSSEARLDRVQAFLDGVEGDRVRRARTLAALINLEELMLVQQMHRIRSRLVAQFHDGSLDPELREDLAAWQGLMNTSRAAGLPGYGIPTPAEQQALAPFPVRNNSETWRAWLDRQSEDLAGPWRLHEHTLKGFNKLLRDPLTRFSGESVRFPPEGCNG